jgi:hypothetical protein
VQFKIKDYFNIYLNKHNINKLINLINNKIFLRNINNQRIIKKISNNLFFKININNKICINIINIIFLINNKAFKNMNHIEKVYKRN